MENELNEYDPLKIKASFNPLSLVTSLPETLSFTLLNVRSLERHAIDIAYDQKLTENYILFLTETQVNQAINLSAMQSILEEYTLDHNISSFRYSSLSICYKSIVF